MLPQVTGIDLRGDEDQCETKDSVNAETNKASNMSYKIFAHVERALEDALALSIESGQI